MNTSKSDNPGDAKPETPAQAEKPVTAPHFRARAKRVPGETTGSLCLISAQHLGLLGAEVAPGRYQLRCPWAHQHAQHCKQRDGILDNSTILYMPGAELSDAEHAVQGDNMPLDGGLFCMHEHSGGDHKGVPLNAEVFLSYARACGAPLPDRPRYMVDGKDEDETAPLLGADLPPQERCDIDPAEPMRAFSFDAEGAINTGELSAEEVREMRAVPGRLHGHPAAAESAKVDKAPPLVMEDGIPTFDSLVNRVSAMLSIPKDVVLASAATLAKSQGFRLPTMRAEKAPAVARGHFTIGEINISVTTTAGDADALRQAIRDPLVAEVADIFERLSCEADTPASPDWFSKFFSECCIADPTGSVSTPDIGGVFSLWYKDKYAATPPMAQFWKALSEKGYKNDRGTNGGYRVRRGLKLIPDTYAYREYQNAEAAALASVDAETKATAGEDPADPFSVLHVAASAETIMLNDLALPLVQIRTNGDEVEITYKAHHKDAQTGAFYVDVIACLKTSAVPVKHAALSALGITALRVTKLTLAKLVSRGVAHATITGINASKKIATDFAEYVGENPTTPFKKFLADCLTPEQADRLQLIFGRMRSTDPRLTDKCYVHVGSGANGKATLLGAVVELFKGVRLSGALESDAKMIMHMDPAIAILESADAVSPVWIKTMATSGAQVHITGNSGVRALDTDQGILRRVEVIRWEKTIPADQRNPDMASEIAGDIDFAFWLFKGQERVQAGER